MYSRSAERRRGRRFQAFSVRQADGDVEDRDFEGENGPFHMRKASKTPRNAPKMSENSGRL